MISRHSTITAVKDQVSCDLEGEAVILHLQSGTYYGLNTVGARIWNLIQEPKTVDTIYGVLIDEFDVEPGRCEKDLMTILQELADRSLVEVST